MVELSLLNYGNAIALAMQEPTRSSLQVRPYGMVFLLFLLRVSQMNKDRRVFLILLYPSWTYPLDDMKVYSIKIKVFSLSIK